MIIIKKDEEIELMRKSCYIAAVALFKAGEAVKPGVTTQHINKIAEDYITSKGAIPSFLNYGGFPASACISVNNEVVHGIPSSNRVLQEGDIVSVDVGAFLNGFHFGLVFIELVLDCVNFFFIQTTVLQSLALLVYLFTFDDLTYQIRKPRFWKSD